MARFPINAEPVSLLQVEVNGRTVRLGRFVGCRVDFDSAIDRAPTAISTLQQFEPDMDGIRELLAAFSVQAHVSVRGTDWRRHFERAIALSASPNPADDPPEDRRPDLRTFASAAVAKEGPPQESSREFFERVMRG
jgi:hypothetical protein